MPPIYYEANNGEVHQIDEVSQRFLVHVYLHGRATPKGVVEPVGAASEDAVHARVQNQLSSDAAGLVDTETETQATLGDHPDNVIRSFVLTEDGEAFVEKHRANMSMPADLAELAKRVAALQIEDNLIEDLRARITSLEERVEELEES